MKRLMTFAAALFIGALCVSAATKKLPPWQDPENIQENRYPMTASFQTGGLNLSLSGFWKFNWN